MSPDSSSSLPLRQRLLRDLLRLRIASGLTQKEMAKRLKVSQSQVSKIESGDRVPSVPVVRAWLKVAGTTAAERTELLALAAAAAVEGIRWREALRAGQAGKQREIAADEAAATNVSSYQNVVIPGLLQTRAYARIAFELADPLGDQDYEQSADARMARQQVLSTEGRPWFDFVLTESAVRWRPVPVDAMLDQLEHLEQALGLHGVSVGIIPFGAPATVLVWNPFTLYDGPEDAGFPFVRVESVHMEHPLHDDEVTARYRDRFTKARAAAVYGDEARVLLGQVARELRG